MELSDNKIGNNVTLRGFCATIVGVEKEKILHILSVCSPSHLTCIAHAPYCHMWPVLFYNIFPLYSVNGTIIDTKLY